MTSREKTAHTMYSMLRLILNEEGMSGLFRAWHIRCASISAVSIIFFAFYEGFRKQFITHYYMDEDCSIDG